MESDLASGPVKGRTNVDRKSDRELVVTRTFDGPARIVFEAWTRPELLKRWWVPKSSGMSLVTCEVDARVGGRYRFEFLHPAFPTPVAFFGRYLELVPHSRIVWTNEESEAGSVTTLTLTEKGGQTHLLISDVYPSKEALDASLEAGNGFPEQFEQLDELLLTLGGSAGRS
jgi:uncharacterized protein YndB with AHSA1/START domain